MFLDDFPRSLEQEEVARYKLASEGEGEGEEGDFPDLVVYFKCKKEVMKERYAARRRGEHDGELFEKRFEQHERDAPAVVERYRARGVLVEVS